MATWRADPSVLLGLLLLAGVYLLGVARLRGAAAKDRVTTTQQVLFMLGLAALFVALESPLDELGDRYLFSVHMTQHLILVLVVPTLLLAGTPGALLRPFLRLRPILAVARALTAPAAAFLLFNLVFALAHLPGVFDLTLHNEGVHIAEHLVFLATAILTWWPVMSPVSELPSLSYPLRMVYLFLQTLPCALVGALITLTQHVLYTPYAAAPRVWNLSPLEDQQAGGLVMWVGGSLYFFLAFTVVFFIWADRDERTSGGGWRLVGKKL